MWKGKMNRKYDCSKSVSDIFGVVCVRRVVYIEEVFEEGGG